MPYLNRSGLTAGRKITVSLSGVIDRFVTYMAQQPFPTALAEGVGFFGLGLSAVFVVDAYNYIGKIINNPRWVVYDNNTSLDNPLLTIYGFEASLDVVVAPVDLQELVDISFKTDANTGEYEWQGLPECGLPRTIYTPSYDVGLTYIGTVNGTSFSPANTNAFVLETGHVEVDKAWPTDGSTPTLDAGGACSANVQLVKGQPFDRQTGYSYENGVTQYIIDNYYDSTMSIYSHAADLGMDLEYPYEFSTPAKIVASITSLPYRYKYKIKDRHGLSVGRLSFADTNGHTWTGGTGGPFEYKGEQVVTAVGEYRAGNTKSISPAFDITDGWMISDPAPARCGGVSVTNPEALNSYDVTIEDTETGHSTTYKPSRVLLYAPLGDNGNLSGSLSVTEAANATLDDFSAEWTASAGTWSNRTLVAAEGTTLTRSGYTRAMYDSEQQDQAGSVTAGDLVPHLPRHNVIKLNGSGLDTTSDVQLIISAKGHKYRFNPVEKTTGYYKYDLTRPEVSGWERDRTDTLYDAWRWETYKSKGEQAWYIDETVQPARLHGPILYDTITFKGWADGVTYNLSSITTEPAANTNYFYTGFEFKQAAECGNREDDSVKFSRNRYLVIMRAGRYVESFCNLKSVTRMGIVTWNFPTIRALTERTGGNKLIFPRDDKNIITVSGSAAAGGSPPPVADLCSTSAYIGWIDVDNGALKIRPVVDYINIDTRLYDGELELDGFCDLGSGWQGFTNAAADTLNIANTGVSGPLQYMRASFGDIPQIRYISGGNEIYKDVEPESVPAFLYRYAVRFGADPLHGYIWRNKAGLILRSAAGVILRGDYLEDE